MSRVPSVRGQRAPRARSHRACTTCKLVARGAPARCLLGPPTASSAALRAARAARRETRVARPIAHCAAVHHPAATHHVLSSLHVERSPHLPGGGVGGWRDAHRSCMLADGRVLARHATRSHAARPHTARAHPPLLRAHLLASCKACSPTISSSRPAPRVPRRATRAARLAARHAAHRARCSHAPYAAK